MDIAFGFGRRLALFILSTSPNLIHPYHPGRVCPGKHLAHSMLTLAAASVLTTFDLRKEVDENGQEIEPKREYKSAGIW